MFKKISVGFIVLTLIVSGTGYLLANTASAMSPMTNFASPKDKGGKKDDQPSNGLNLNCSGGAKCCNGVKTSISYGCKSNGGKLGHNPIFGLLLAVINFLAIGVGIAVVVGIILGAYKFMTAQGNANQVVQAKNTIGNAILALFLFAFMWAALNFLVPGGVFSS